MNEKEVPIASTIENNTPEDNPFYGYSHIYQTGPGRKHICIGFTCWCKPWLDGKLIMHTDLPDS